MKYCLAGGKHSVSSHCAHPTWGSNSPVSGRPVCAFRAPAGSCSIQAPVQISALGCLLISTLLLPCHPLFGLWTGSSFLIPTSNFLKRAERILARTSVCVSIPFPPPPPFILAQERVPSMSTAVGSNLISSYLIDCPPSCPTGNPAAFFCRQKNISLLINLSTGI